MRQPPAPERERALLKLYTRKEALLKAFGVGLVADPASLPGVATGLVAPPMGASGAPPCRAGDLDLPAGRIGALATPGLVTRCRLDILNDALAAWGCWRVLFPW
ncbi:hypothetical protein HDE77_004108 [Rhodanobacter sp. MP7CTX1]|nr:hypothetical protein [Rhodanobacter sp. MP7CTX1]